MKLQSVFYPEQPPGEPELERSRRLLIVEGAAAAIIYSSGTGNFLAGYLTYLGASVAVCAAAAMIPQLGCILQFFSPLLFERTERRKLPIFVLCVIFRFSLSVMFLLPLFSDGRTVPVEAALFLYCTAFLAAGLVTPGLTNLVLNNAPQIHRGAYFAHKEITAAVVNGIAAMLLGRMLDRMMEQDRTGEGFVVIGAVCLALSLLDASLLLQVSEQPAASYAHMRIKDIAMPTRDPIYQPLLRYYVLGGLVSGISSSFLSVYELRVLELSHTYITTAGIVAAAAGVFGGWFWGRYADRTSWPQLFKITAFLSLLCTLSWAFVRPSTAYCAAGLIMAGTAFCSGGQNIASQNLQFYYSPQKGKTAYFGVTSALSSLAACGAAFVSTSIEPMLENRMGGSAIALLFFLSGTLGLLNFFVNIRKIRPGVR